MSTVPRERNGRGGLESKSMKLKRGGGRVGVP
jgi:hypothetical protein